jgi:two-component system chemotaxis response regulator CheY
MQVTSMNGDANDTPMKLPEVLDLAAADGFLESMRQRMSDERPLCIDASAVEMLTLPCIQIILAAGSFGGGISIQNPSSAFVTAIDDLGINLTSSLDQSQHQEHDQEQSQEQSQEQTQSQVEDAPRQVASGDGPQDELGNIDLQQISENVMNKRILTIDDSKTMRDMLMLTLAEAGFDVLQAVDGQDGLDVLVNEQVDVVITDINMPRMDGYEVIRQLRSNPSHKATPILVLTTEGESEKKNLAREAGATGWMVKPFDPDRLVATVRKVAP